MDSTVSFGYWLRRRRRAHDLTQEALAKLVGCAVVTIRKIEADESRPSRQMAERLAECLAIPAVERATFLKAARAELATDRLPLPEQPVSSPQVVAQPVVPIDVGHLPTGTVAFLFTDIEGSTRLWEQQPHVMEHALARHDAILREAIDAYGGQVVKTVGDAFHAVFTTVAAALAAALAGQRALAAEVWGPSGPLRVRMALHVGTAQQRDGDYFGPQLNRTARLLSAGHGAQILLSRSAQGLVCDDLPPGVSLRDLGEHRLKDLGRPEQIFQVVAPDLPTDFPPLLTLDRQSNNLPTQPTPLIGREQEVADVRALLRRDAVRLVTLTGPGGTGKTRLGLQVAAELLDDVADGVWFVNLAPLSDPSLVATTIAKALGVRESSGQPLLEGLKATLHAQQVLLLLDNFEQVVDAAPLLGELLAAAPGLKVLVTSRMPLRLMGEYEVGVGPLALPDRAQPQPLERLTQSDAVRLFIARAQAVKADFAVTNENAPAVAEICYRLDGLPLAIELAAARVKLFPPQALLGRLGSRLRLLTGGARDLPFRQQTIRNTIDWSYHLLDEGEKTLFARLGVFVGGCTLAAAEAVCAADGKLPLDVVDGVAALLDQSLLRQGHSGVDEPRFTMLQTIREYAQEQLAARGEAEALRRQHATYYLGLAATGEPQPFADAAAWLTLLEPEQDNVRAALSWALEGGDVALGVRLAAVFRSFWYHHFDWAEGRRWLVAALAALPGPAGSGEIGEEWKAMRASVLLGVGLLTFNLGDTATSRAQLEASVSLYREVGDQAGLALALYELGAVAEHAYSDYELARTLQEESVALLRELGDMRSVAWALLSLAGATLGLGQHEQARALFEESVALFRTLDPRAVFWPLSGVAGVALNQDDYAAARAVYEECLAMARELGNPWQTSYELHWLGAAVAYQGDYAQAAALLEESLALAREMRQQVRSAELLNMLGEVAQASGDHSRAAQLYQESLALNSAFENQRGRATSLRNLGRVAMHRGEYERAATHLKESLLLLHELGDQIGIASCLGSVAGLAGAQGRPERAARLFGAAQALREATRMPRWQGILYEETYNRNLAITRAQLGEAAWVAGWAEGRAMSVEQTIADALDEATTT